MNIHSFVLSEQKAKAMSLFTHWACFDCRKSFHKRPSETAWKCPDCTKPMTDMGIYFEPPVRKALKKWKVLRVLGENGYKFQTEASRFYIEEYILIEKNPSPEWVRKVIKFRKRERVEFEIKQRLRWEKKFWRKQK